MGEVKRYEIGGPDWEMDLSPIGEWVCYDDYAALEAECDTALAECERLRGFLIRASRAESAAELMLIVDAALSVKP